MQANCVCPCKHKHTCDCVNIASVLLSAPLAFYNTWEGIILRHRMDKSCTVSGKLSAAELNQSLFLERDLDSEKQLKKCSDYVKDFPHGLVASELTGKMGVFSAAINFQMHNESRTLR